MPGLEIFYSVNNFTMRSVYFSLCQGFFHGLTKLLASQAPMETCETICDYSGNNFLLGKETFD